MTWRASTPIHGGRTAPLVLAGVALSGLLAWSGTMLLPEYDAASASIVQATPVDLSNGAEPAMLGDLERGRVYYAQVCMPCHGARGDGLGEWAYRVTPRPADLTRAKTRARSDGELYHIITEGLPGTAMVGWRGKLSDAQRSQVIAYVRHLGRRGLGHE